MLTEDYDYLELVFNNGNRTTGSSDNPTFAISPSLTVKGYKLKYAIISEAFYVINENNNNLQFMEQATDGTTRTAAIAYGDYTLSTLATALADSMTTAGTQTYTVAYNTSSNILTITAAANFKILASSSMSYELGIGSDSSYGLTNYSGNVDLSGPKMIYIVSPEISSSCSVVGWNANCLSTIPLSGGSGNITYYENTSNEFFTNEQTLSSISFQLFDDKKRAISLNGKDYTLCIGFLVE